MDSLCDSYYVGTNNDTVSIEIFPNTEIDYPSVSSSTATNCTEYDCPSLKTLTIPSRINSKPIIEIGCAAFSKIKTIEIVEINAQITKIHQFAFYGCSQLTSINIPSTVQVLGFCAISTIVNNNPDTATASGLLSVKFEPNSTIKAIERYGIERKKNIVVYFCGYEAPNIQPRSLFHGTTTSIVFSPIPLNWSEIATEPDPAVCSIIEQSIQCQKRQKITCGNPPFHLSFIALVVNMILPIS